MQLRPVSFQSDAIADQPFSKYYESFMVVASQMVDETPNSITEHCQQILQFIRLLENDFSGPPQWVSTSRFDVVFHDQDYQSYSDTSPDGSSVLLTVRASKNDDGSWEFWLSDTKRKQPEVATRNAASAAATAAAMLSN